MCFKRNKLIECFCRYFMLYTKILIIKNVVAVFQKVSSISVDDNVFLKILYVLIV